MQHARGEIALTFECIKEQLLGNTGTYRHKSITIFHPDCVFPPGSLKNKGCRKAWHYPLNLPLLQEDWWRHACPQHAKADATSQRQPCKMFPRGLMRPSIPTHRCPCDTGTALTIQSKPLCVPFIFLFWSGVLLLLCVAVQALRAR